MDLFVQCIYTWLYMLLLLIYIYPPVNYHIPSLEKTSINSKVFWEGIWDIYQEGIFYVIIYMNKMAGSRNFLLLPRPEV